MHINRTNVRREINNLIAIAIIESKMTNGHITTKQIYHIKNKQNNVKTYEAYVDV